MLKRFILLFILLISTPLTPAHATEDPMHMTNLYSLITHQQGWLNTVRALKPEDLKGRIILLDFWTYCCINCMHVIPDLAYLEEKFGDDLTVIGVHSAKFKNEQDSENIRQAILRYDLHHPVVNDFDFSTWKSFGIRAWPTFVLINPKGLIEAVYSGEGNRAQAERDIERLRTKYSSELNRDKLPIALEKDKQPPSVLSFPAKIVYTADFNGKPVFFVSDSGHHRVVVMTPQGAIIDTVGSGKNGNEDGAFDQVSFSTPQGVLYKDKILYIADTNNHTLRAADFSTRTVTTIAGNGKQGHERDANHRPALEASLASPWDITLYPDDKHIVIAMAGTHQLWSYDIEGKTVSVIAGSGNESIDDGHLPFNSLAQTSGLSPAGGKLYFVDAETSSLRVFENGDIKTLIGTGLFDFGYKEGKRSSALMQHPLGLFATDSIVYVADSYNHSIRSFDPATGVLSNFAGHGVRGKNDGGADVASFNESNAIVQVDKKLYVADTNNNAIRVIDLESKKVSTLTITEQPKSEAVEFGKDLPNTEKTDVAEVSTGSEIVIAIELQQGWHINKDAPSYLALFDIKATPKAVVSFDRDAVKTQHLTLPALVSGSYRLQGTLYYCEDKEGAQCLIKSFDMEVVAKDGGAKEVALKLN